MSLLYCIFCPEPVSQQGAKEVLERVAEMGTPGFHLTPEDDYTIRVIGQPCEFNDETCQVGKITLSSVDAMLNQNGLDFGQFGVEVASTWKFEKTDESEPFPQMLMWDALTAFCCFITGYVWLRYPHKESFRELPGQLLEFSNGEFAVDTDLLLSYALGTS